MKAQADIPEIAISISTAGAWGRLIIRGIMQYADEAGPWNLQWILPHELEYLLHNSRSRPAGLIAHITSKEQSDSLLKTGIPLVDISDAPVALKRFPNVRNNDEKSIQLACDYLTDRGFKNLGIVAPEHLENPVWYINTFLKETSHRGISAHRFIIRNADRPETQEITEWLRQLPKPSGLLVWGHAYARVVLKCCLAANISIPHEIAVLSGNYDEILSQVCYPKLSGLLLPTERIGHKAAELLHRLLRGDNISCDTTYVEPLGIQTHVSTDTLAITDPRMRQVVEYIREHALEPITISDIVHAVPMTQRTLERRFRQLFGHTIMDETRRIRIKKARQLLAETDMPLQLVAETCGYSTYNYLSKVFKESTNMSPGEYRKSQL